MTYTVTNYPTKKALKEAVTLGYQVKCFEPGLGSVPDNGKVYLEGPHFPAPHKWYAEAWLQDGLVVRVK